MYNEKQLLKVCSTARESIQNFEIRVSKGTRQRGRSKLPVYQIELTISRKRSQNLLNKDPVWIQYR